MTKTFINLSNHPSDRWDKKQKEAALSCGEIVDIKFPSIDPHGTSEGIDRLVSTYLEDILSYEKPVVMVQGEFVFTFRMITELKKRNIKAVAGCSERKVTEEKDEAGNTVRRSVFSFVKFMEY